MSLSGAMTTAVGGLDAQSRALGAISDNIANSQTIGYKRIETSFSTLLSVSNSRVHEPGGVLSRPKRTNDVQGSVQQTSAETNLALSGDGFFAVNRVSGVGPGGVPSFEADPIYTRAGDFAIDGNGFLVNSAGYYLSGWPIDASTGAADKNSMQPIRITQFRDNPQPTQNIDYSINLPSAPSNLLDTDSATTDIEFPPTTVDFFDALGQPHQLDVQWTKVDPVGPPINNNEWICNVTTNEPGVTVTSPAAGVHMFFNVANDPVTGAQAGSLQTLDGVTGAVGSDAIIPFQIDFTGPAASTVNMNFNVGKFGVAEQTTMFTGSDIEFRSANQDGLPPGSFRNLEIGSFGQLSVNYDNGARREIFQIPVAVFSNANGLKLENGNGYSVTAESGTPNFTFPGSSGAGTLVASAVEGSNVDIAAEFTKMIQTQRAYGANTRVITVTSQLLEETNNIIR
jgi:flagellar hook protein FlgE